MGAASLPRDRDDKVTSAWQVIKATTADRHMAEQSQVTAWPVVCRYRALHGHPTDCLTEPHMHEQGSTSPTQDRSPQPTTKAQQVLPKRSLHTQPGMPGTPFISSMPQGCCDPTTVHNNSLQGAVKSQAKQT